MKSLRKEFKLDSAQVGVAMAVIVILSGFIIVLWLTAVMLIGAL